MGSEEVKFFVTLAFLVGFVLGYKAKDIRISWLKRKRDRLAKKLQQAQIELDSVTKKE